MVTAVNTSCYDRTPFVFRRYCVQSCDKELSEFTSNTISFTVSYHFVQNDWYAIDRGSINFAYGHIMFEYDDFRDLRKTAAAVGREPLYVFSANMAQAFALI
jgi:hypothetical protein